MMVVDFTGVERLSAYTCFEVQVLGGGTSCSAHQGNRLSCMHPCPLLYQVAYVVAIGSLEAVSMANHHEIAVGIIGPAQYHFPRECCTYRISSLGLDICASMPSASSKWTYHLTIRQGVAPLLIGIVGKVDRELVGVQKGVLRGFNPHYLPFVDVNISVVLSLWLLSQTS